MKGSVFMKKSMYKLVFSSLFAAMCCVATMVVQIPLPTGYVNIGDCFVIVSGFLLGPIYGGFAAAIGSCLADVFTGYASFAPATFVIKGLMAVVCALLVKAIANRHLGRIVSGVVAEIVMVFGYFAWSALLFGEGLAAAASIPGNLVQAGVGIVTAYIFSLVIDKIHIVDLIKE